MVLKWLINKTLPAKAAQPAPSSQTKPSTLSHSHHSAPLKNIYPPNDQGLPVRTIDDLLEGNRDLIDRIKQQSGSQQKIFEDRFQSPIRNLAGLVNSLPGTPTSLFSGEGGMLRACLEMGFLSFQASDGRIFTGAANVETRHKLEPRWRYICFAAGLLYPMGLPLSRMTVSANGGASWQKHQYGLTEWALTTGVDRVYVNWPGDMSASGADAMGPSAFTASVIGKIFGHETLSWLDEGSPDLTRAVFEILGGGETQARIAKDVVLTIWEKVKKREEARRPEAYGRMSVGTHLHPYLIGAMQTLVSSQTWKPNDLPFIVDATGIYLVWPQAGEDIVRQGAKEGRDGWPASAATLAELMKQSGIFDTSRGNDMGMTEVVDADGVVHSAFKMRNPNAIMEDYEPSDFTQKAPKTLEGVLQQDPINRHERKPAPVTPVVDVQSDDVLPSENQDTAEVTYEDPDDDELEEEIAQPQEPEMAPVAERARPPEDVGHAEQAQPGVIKEAAEVKFSDLVPPEVRRDIKSSLSVEVLGKIIKAWRERGERNEHMRMTDKGAAISREYLMTQMRSLPDWLNDVGAAGLIYTAPATPGMKVHKVAIPEGSKPKDAIVISNYGVKKLGL